MYQQNEKVTFPVKGSRVANGNLYFQIYAHGQEYDIRAFEFQRINRPKRLQCIVKGFDEQERPIFMQDIAAIIPQLYTVGEIYQFRVKADNIGGGYYEVVDTNGLVFRLKHIRHVSLHPNDIVKCKVLWINLVRMELQFINDGEYGLPFFTVDKFINLAPDGKALRPLMGLLINKIPDFSEARNLLAEANPDWVMKVVEAVDRNLSAWLKNEIPRTLRDNKLSIQRSKPSWKRPPLKTFHAICINLLENSDYLRRCAPQARYDIQDRLNRIITHTGDYLKALDLIVDREHEKYLNDTLTRLKVSGYLYNPEERMRVAMALFTLMSDTVSDYIDNIFDIICDSHSRPRFMKLFSKAFVEMLDMYISNESRKIDLLTGPSERKAIQQMIKALALRLLLPGDESENMRALYRAKLYRYVTLLVNINSEQLIGKAVAAIFDHNAPLEFTWNDLGDINLLCSKIAVASKSVNNDSMMIYEGEGAMMCLSGEHFTFAPTERGEALRNCIPAKMFPDNKLRLMLNGRVSERLDSSRANISQTRRYWREVEESLLSLHQNTSGHVLQGIRPDIGDEVNIRILGPHPACRYDFRVEIVDDTFVGEGIINVKQIVSYPIIPVAGTFTDREVGLDCIYRARVESRKEDGTYTFNMRPLIHEYLKEATASGDEWLAQVSRCDKDQYLCISEGGFSFFLDRRKMDVDLNQGDFIFIEIMSVNNTGTIEGHFLGFAEERFQQTEALRSLLEHYCQGNYYDPVEEINDDFLLNEDLIDEARRKELFIEPDQMRELVQVIDRMGLLSNNHITTYNYMAVARIMSLMLGDTQTAAYFARRMDLVEAISNFGDSGKIDDERLNKLLNDNREFIQLYPDINCRLTRLSIINNLDKPWRVDSMWETARDNTDETTSSLARLVLSYNMLHNSNLFEVRRTLKRKIFQLMNLKMLETDNQKVAEEDQYTELKTSIIYPAGNSMVPNERQQISTILKVIASFLNTSGGRLYIGVNDSGYASGLHNDFTYLNNRHEDYDLQTVKDKFDRAVRDNVHNRLGRSANALITTDFEKVDGMIIYRVDVDPSPEVVMLDGEAYERQGKSIWKIPEGELDKVRAQRAKQFAD